MSGPFTSPVAYSVPFNGEDPAAVTAGITADNVFDAILEAKTDALNNDRYPISCFYGGNANVNRFLEFFSGIDSSQSNAPFIPPENSVIRTIVAGSAANSTGTISIYKNGNYVTSLYDITYTSATRVILTGLSIPITALDEISIRVSSGSINKPFIRIWVNTVT